MERGMEGCSVGCTRKIEPCRSAQSKANPVDDDDGDNDNGDDDDPGGLEDDTNASVRHSSPHAAVHFPVH